MKEKLILLSEFCSNSCAEPDFVLCLEREGLIDTRVRDNIKYLLSSQLDDLEMFTRLHYDLSINVEGIDVIHNLLNQISEMEQELSILRRQAKNMLSL